MGIDPLSKITKGKNNNSQMQHDVSVGTRNGVAANRSGTVTNQDYEMWLKMAADNKINPKNSWSFALIDYFYDLSRQPIVNFPRASAILDGCIKIYASRVDSVATETGTLLSGLASHRELEAVKENLLHQEETENERNYYNRRRNVRVESTLVKDFSIIRARSIEKELNVDPMFRRTLSYFDEGGAKSLLLNNLNIDRTGRVIFDVQSDVPNETMSDDSISSNSWNTLKTLFFLEGEQIDHLQVCDSLQGLKQLLQNPDRERTEATLYESFYENEDNYYDDIPEENYDPNDLIFDEESEPVQEELELSEFPDYELMNYFDERLKNSYSRSDYWKVDNVRRKFTSRMRVNKETVKQKPKQDTSESVQKATHIIDFITREDPEDENAFEDEIFSESVAKISIPVVHRQLGKRNNNFCLPEDTQFKSRRLIQLFTKPQTLLKSFNKKIAKENLGVNETLENYTAPVDEPSRLLDEATREDLMDLNDTLVQDFSLNIYDNDNDFYEKPTNEEKLSNDKTNIALMKSRNLHNQLNFEKISKRIDIKLIKKTMMEKINDKITFQELVKSIPHELNGSTSIYFICLLHLCNEFELTLHSMDNDLLVYKSL